MLETTDDLAELQRLLDASARSAGSFLRETFEMPDRTPTGGQLAAYLQGAVSLVVATVTERCEPRVAPVTALFVHGRFWIPTEAHASRVRQLRANPAVSVTHSVGNVAAIIAHGAASVVAADDVEGAAVDALHSSAWWEPLRREGRGVYLRVEADRLFAWMGAQWPESVARTS